MRILLAGKFTHLGSRPIGGLQSWIYTVACELTRRGHAVTCWQPGKVLVGRFHMGIFANLAHTRECLAAVDQSILVSHGIIDAERPEPGCDVTAFVSENVRDHWGMNGPVIRQPIDLEFWSPGNGERHHLVRYSYRTGRFHGPEVARRMGLPYRHVHGVSHIVARAAMRGGVCVYATGRAALEAAACGVPVVIYDHRAAYQGPLLAEFDGQMEKSYSGRGGIEPGMRDVMAATEKAIERGSRRAHVEEHHDVRKIVEQLLCLMS